MICLFKMNVRPKKNLGLLLMDAWVLDFMMPVVKTACLCAGWRITMTSSRSSRNRRRPSPAPTAATSWLISLRLRMRRTTQLCVRWAMPITHQASFQCPPTAIPALIGLLELWFVVMLACTLHITNQDKLVCIDPFMCKCICKFGVDYINILRGNKGDN